MSTEPRERRLLIHSPDSYGLGHLRRSLRIAGAVTAVDPQARVLVLSGSPRVRSFDLPERVEVVGLPAVTKRGPAYAARTLGGGLDEVVRVRSALTLAAVDAFEPTTVYVDHAPLGVGGELRPLLDALATRNRRPHMVLGLRDIIDRPDRVERDWHRDEVWSALPGYDEVLVHGDRRVLSTAVEIDLHHRVRGPVRHVGYLGGPRVVPAERRGRPVVLVTSGGGGDGARLLRRYVGYLATRRTPAPWDSVVVTGPLLADRRAREIDGLARIVASPVRVISFTEDMSALMASASAAISMGGYNSMVELVAHGVPTLVVPREEPRAEQLLRAQRLCPLVGFRWSRLADLDDADLDEFFDSALDGGCPVDASAVSLAGLDDVAATLANRETSRVA